MRRLTNIIVVAALATAGLAGSAFANFPSDDMRSPDARSSAPATSPVVDLRSPDARDTSGVATYEPGSAPQQPIVLSGDAFQWSDAGIGAAAMLGLIALGGVTLLVVVSRRRERRLPPAIS